MIRKNLKEHSMGVWTKSHLFRDSHDQRPPIHGFIPNERMVQHRWVLRVHGLDLNHFTNSNDVLFFVKLESKPNVNQEYGSFNGINIPLRQTWSPIEVKIIDAISDVNTTGFLHDWMNSDRKLAVTLEKLSPVGDILEKWHLYGSFIQEMNHEVVYDRTIGDIIITLNYDYANLIF